MSCFLCGGEEGHHLGCVRAQRPDLTATDLVTMGLMAAPPEAEQSVEPVVEVLKENSMTTEIVSGACEWGDCENLKYSSHPRVKYCIDHKDPKNRKE